MNEQWNYPGSRWWKGDFHTHTPASDDYGRGNDTIKDSTTQELWLQHCMQAGLDFVVVTDHNSGGWIADLRAKYSEMDRARPTWFHPLTIFPGVEITVSLGTGRVHLLAVFDPEKADGNTISAVLGKCDITSGFGDDKITSTKKSFEDTVDAVHESGGIAIAAHIDGPQGLLNGVTTLNPEMKRSLEKIYAAEFCDLHAFDNSNAALINAVRRLALLGGSDAHLPDEIGRHSTWVKMSRPSIDGLRLALVDHEFCVNNEEETPNHAPDIFICSLEISSMRHCGRATGQPLTMSFHPLFNTVIGGRGTGKSTALESIRIAARRDGELEEIPRLSEELNRFMAHASHKGVMLDNTELRLGIHRRGKEYRLRWRFDSTGTVLEEKSSDIWNEINAGDLRTIRERFPMSIYSQKQINELAANPKGLLEILDRSPEVNRGEWEQRWGQTKNKFMQLRLHQREINQLLARETDIRAKLTDVENDLKQYEERGHGEILKNYQKHAQQLRAMPTDSSFDDLAERIRTLAEDAVSEDFPAHLFPDGEPMTEEVRNIHSETAMALSAIQKQLLELAYQVEQISAERKRKLTNSHWYQQSVKVLGDYQALVKEYEEKGGRFDPAVYGQWVQQRTQLLQDLANLETQKKEAARIQEEISKIYSNFLSLREDLYNKRIAFIQSVVGDNHYVRMELVPFGDTNRVASDYRALLALEENKFESSLLDRDGRRGILYKLSNWEDVGIDPSQLPEIIRSVKVLTSELAAGEMQNVPDYVHGHFTNRLQRSLEQQPANFDELMCWWPDDLLRVKYVRDRNKTYFEDLEKGSAGQKAAAILAFLLSHGEEPLIIDQPEDDLDNALIYDLVVRQIHENKKKRQLIVVTHNPNIVVNGDAELVHVLEFRGGQVHLAEQGGLEEHSVRECICQIMEGGREAFEKRYKRMTLEV